VSIILKGGGDECQFGDCAAFSNAWALDVPLVHRENRVDVQIYPLIGCKEKVDRSKDS
jgi:hypothetical protein